MPEDLAVNTERLLTRTEALLRRLHVVRDGFGLKPSHDHIATCINYSDLIPMRDDFVRELQASLISYVYSSGRQEEIRKKLQEEGRDESAAFDIVRMRARDKFRPFSTQGQFAELLLFNLLQHFFKAAPLLRKMPLTTSPGHERFGADAFHIRNNEGKYTLYLGESKAYKPKTAQFSTALKDAITSILDHHSKHRNELNLYVFEEFISPELEEVAQRYLEGKANDIEVHLVCLVAYESANIPKGGNSKDLLDSVISSLRADAAALKHDFFDDVPPALLPRLNYILFPINDLEGLIKEFHKQLGFGEAKSTTRKTS